MRDTDVLIIGGGPAGSTAAALLARSGHRVTLIEKARHPRFHIGESLLPANLPLLERLGVADEVRAIGMQKWGAEFISPWDGRQQEFRFCEAWDKSMPFAYQVRRSEFDRILIRHAERSGAQVIEGARVTAVELGQGEGRARVIQKSRQKCSTRMARFPMARAIPDRCLRPRHVSRQSAAVQAAQRAAQQRRHVRTLHRRRAQRGRPRRTYIDLLVRSWLVLVHSAERWRDQRRRRGLAVLPEAPHAPGQRFPARYHRTVPAARRAPARARSSSAKSRPRATIRTPARNPRRATICCSAMPTPSSIRCSPRA